ncbi:MAG: choice-of-anchor Q domain-containing protein [Candidatus Zipacnadales bacterium]
MLGALLGVVFPVFGATYYVSNEGSDENDGLSPQTAWATLDRVNQGPFNPGEVILFRRGDTWRGQLIPFSGSEEGPITYGAYGKGPKPLFLGSIARGEPEDWMNEGQNIWSTIPPETAAGREVLPQGATDRLPWSLHREGGAEAIGGWDEEVFDSAPASYRVECVASGERGNHLQLSLSPFQITKGKLYRLRFRAKCTSSFSLTMPTLMMAGAPWAPYAKGGVSSVQIGSDWTLCQQNYITTVSAADARLTFYLGGALPAGAVLYIDSLSLQECEGTVWLPADVGNIIFDNEASCGVKVWNEEDLVAQDQFWYDEARHVVKMYSVRNPAEQHTAIELAIRDHLINQSNRHHVIYENLAFKYAGAHGIGGGNTHHIIVRDCDFSFIGGGDQMGGDHTVRFGNGIEFWGAAHDNLVERCRLWEIYDAALTNQSSGPNTPQYNIIYRNNVIWNSEYSFEYWNRPENSETYNVSFINNTCVNAGYGWGHTQRPDPSGRHLCFYTSPARLRNMVIRNNIFFEAKTNAFYAPSWTKEQIDALVMDHNCWYQAEGEMIKFAQPYTMAHFAQYQQDWHKELHSLCAVPGFVDLANYDFHLGADSPCIDAGSDEGLALDFDGISIPQGKAPDIGAYERQ